MWQTDIEIRLSNQPTACLCLWDLVVLQTVCLWRSPLWSWTLCQPVAPPEPRQCSCSCPRRPLAAGGGGWWTLSRFPVAELSLPSGWRALWSAASLLQETYRLVQWGCLHLLWDCHFLFSYCHFLCSFLSSDWLRSSWVFGSRLLGPVELVIQGLPLVLKCSTQILQFLGLQGDEFKLLLLQRFLREKILIGLICICYKDSAALFGWRFILLILIEQMVDKFLKSNVHCWHLWFSEESLTSMEPLYEILFKVEKVYLDYQMVKRGYFNNYLLKGSLENLIWLTAFYNIDAWYMTWVTYICNHINETFIAAIKTGFPGPCLLLQLLHLLCHL